MTVKVPKTFLEGGVKKFQEISQRSRWRPNSRKGGSVVERGWSSEKGQGRSQRRVESAEI